MKSSIVNAKRLVCLAAVVSALTCVVAPTVSSAQSMLTIRYGEINGSLAFVPHEVAKSLGLFKKLETEKKIKLELAGFTVGNDETRALAGGQLDMASSMYIEIAVPMALGEPLTNVLVFNNAGTTSLLVAKKYKAQTLSELKAELGRPMRVGITSFGSGSDLLARTFLDYSKVAKEDYQIVPLGGLNAFFPALQQGRVDLVQASEPAGQRLSDEGIGKFVVDGWDRTGVERLLGTSIQINGVHVRNEFMEKHPEAVQAVVDVMLEAMDYIRKNIDQPEKIIPLLPPDLRNQVQGKEGPVVLHRVMSAMSPNGCPSLPAADAVQKSLEAAELLKPTKVDWSKFQTARFLRGACK